MVGEAVQVGGHADGGLDGELRGDDARQFVDVRFDEHDGMGVRRDGEDEVATDGDVHPETPWHSVIHPVSPLRDVRVNSPGRPGSPPGARYVAEVTETGLRAAEVAERVAAGKVNHVDDSSSRSLGDIVRSNVLTRFNALISALAVVVLVVGSPRDALFAVVMVFNAVIGIAQELRSKRTLDRLSVIAAPRLTVVRDGAPTVVDRTAVVLDDVVVLAPGDQLVVDGTIGEAGQLSIDESLLTGEADAVAKSPGDAALSGSFVVAGSGTMRTTAVGDDAYAAALDAGGEGVPPPSDRARTGHRHDPARRDVDHRAGGARPVPRPALRRGR